jgi:uncharacterized membrane protein YsdA (DUF1294 family)
VNETVVLVVLGVYGVASVLTFVAYGIDKRRAVRGDWRIRERTLHLMELAGGWPGALAGQAVFRHKRCKGAYMAVFGTIAVGHLGAWVVGLVYLFR